MKIETVKTVKGELSHCIMDENEIVCTISEFLDLIRGSDDGFRR